MHEDQRSRVKFEATFENFPGIDRHVIDSPDGEALIRHETVLPIEIEVMKPLRFAANGQRAIVQHCLPGRQDRVLIEVAQQDLARLIDTTCSSADSGADCGSKANVF